MLVLQQRSCSLPRCSRDNGVCCFSGRTSSLRAAPQTYPASTSSNGPAQTSRRLSSSVHGLQLASDDGASSSQGASWVLTPALAACSVLALGLASCSPALAADGVTYNPEGGDTLIKTLSGIGYIVLLAFFLLRVLNRNARRAREEKIAGQGPIVTPFTTLLQQKEELRQPGKATAFTAFLGAVQAGVIAFGLFVFTDKVSTLIEGASLPDQYTARNMAVTVRTIILGLLYLITFIFSANAVGLGALSVQMLIDPDSVRDDEEEEAAARAARAARGPALPKVSVTSSPEEIRRAFESVSSAQSSAASPASSTPLQTASDTGSTEVASSSSTQQQP